MRTRDWFGEEMKTWVLFKRMLTWASVTSHGRGYRFKGINVEEVSRLLGVLTGMLMGLVSYGVTWSRL